MALQVRQYRSTIVDDYQVTGRRIPPLGVMISALSDYVNPAACVSCQKSLEYLLALRSPRLAVPGASGGFEVSSQLLGRTIEALAKDLRWHD